MIYLHSRKISHKDTKLNNILLALSHFRTLQHYFLFNIQSYLIYTYSQMKTHQSFNSQKRFLRQKDEHPKTGMIDSIKGYLTNISYGFQGITFSLANRSKVQQSQKSLIYVCGKHFDSLEEGISAHKSIIWFTYRKNCKITVTLTSDIGWGCMIRVAQMALAESLKRLFKAQHIRTSYSYLISAFLQSQTTNKYSLSRFLEMANKLFLKQPGQWFSISEIAIIMQELHSLNPLKGTESLHLIVNHQSLVLSAAQTLLSHKDNIHTGQRLFEKQKPLISFSQPASYGNSLLIIITTQLGNKEVTEKNYNYLLEAMTWPQMVGCIGGCPKRARFLTGRNADRLSYLDPHYVEKEVDRLNLSQEIDKFCCKQYRLMDRHDLDPNVAFCFFIKDRAELEALAQSIQKWKGEGVIQLNRMTSIDRSEWVQLGTKVPHRQLSQEDALDWRSNSSMESSFIMD